MQQYYRIALGMCLLIGYLQAHPVTRFPINIEEFGLDLLDGVSCEPNVTFTSPRALEGVCYDSILKLKEGWEHARENCGENASRISQTVEYLGHVLNMTQRSECNFTMEVHEQFGSFLNATKEFAQIYSSQ